MELTIIIPSVGDMAILTRTLDAVLLATQTIETEIILVDDSADGIVEVDNPRLKVVRSYGKGASNARNEGLKHAKSDLILFLDDDILISENHILETLQLHKESSKKAYNFYWVYPEDLMRELPETKFGKYVLHEGLYSNQHRLEGKYDELPKLTKQKGLTSQYFSIEKRWLDEVGGYDSIPYAGIEDLLLFRKLERIGIEVFLVKDQVVFQNEANRIQADKLFNRYRTGALTRRIAALRGHKDLGVQFNGTEKIKGELGTLFLPLLRLIENKAAYGLLYRKVVHYILFTGTYLGYFKDELPTPFAEEFNN
ncbi:glycosyltransferase family 2 protein [Cryomorpha ignava]|uniref:Glycosyltransferase family 2 protein n=1 Tax=Cryomorpha ignava TaxID=101383 RepID=A0A7K3WP42_9FLAO|nr:glycosyltransferase family A protein [Cryomorpha ignava]NEN23417.1 glycosyltransferase family 2 protein [Cryomorpha ignava]